LNDVVYVQKIGMNKRNKTVLVCHNIGDPSYILSGGHNLSNPHETIAWSLVIFCIILSRDEANSFKVGLGIGSAERYTMAGRQFVWH